MTRINAAIKPSELSDKHLLAEYREISRVPNLAKNWLNRKDKLPENFTLNSGHVKFFYDKIKYLHIRFLRLKDELIDREYELNIDDSRFIDLIDTELYNDWIETEEARNLLVERILDRLEEKKIFINKKEISYQEYEKMIKLAKYERV